MLVKNFKNLAKNSSIQKARIKLGGDVLVDEEGNEVDVAEIVMEILDESEKAEEDEVVEEEEEDDAPKRKVDGEDEEDDEAEKRMRAEIRKGFKTLENKIDKGHNVSVIEDHTSRFKTFGEYLGAVAMSCHPSAARRVDKRLYKAAPVVNTTIGTAATAGNAVPDYFLNEILKDLWTDQDSLAARCRRVDTPNSNLVVPSHESTPWGATSVQANVIAEGAIITQSQVQLGLLTIGLVKHSVLVPVTSELLEDNPVGLEQFVSVIANDAIVYDVNRSIMQGAGPSITGTLGVVPSAGTITVPIETGQTAYLVYENLVNMWSRLKQTSRRNAVWVVNQQLEPYLRGVAFEGTSSSTPIYIPGNTLAGTPFDSLMGAPVLFGEYSSALGTAGDIALCDFSQYIASQKTSGLRSDVSIEAAFEWDTTMFRFLLRFGGSPWRQTPITSQDGNQTYGHFVILGGRSGS